jgi:CheY-like chemotaxis protein
MIVLVVDDDFDIRDSLADVLRDEGYGVEVAADGEEALAQLRRMSPPPGLILLDWMMPRCDGEQFRAQQKIDPELASIPVVLLTADARLPEKRALLDVDDYLAKPVDLDLLLETVGRYAP